jgi:hypothetical protein
MTPEVALVCSELAGREPIYHHPELGTTREAFDAQTDQDFWEVGASGRVYGREEIWSVVAERWGDPDDADAWEVSDVHCRELGAGHYLLTYELRQGERVTRRATVWRRTPGGWQVVYHQGTLVATA